MFLTPALRYACFTEQRSQFAQYECELVHQLAWQDSRIVKRLDGAGQTTDAWGYTSQYTPPNRVAAFQTIKFAVIAEPGQYVGFRVGMQRSKPHTAFLHLEPRGSSWTESAILSVLFQPLCLRQALPVVVFFKRKKESSIDAGTHRGSHYVTFVCASWDGCHYTIIYTPFAIFSVYTFWEGATVLSPCGILGIQEKAEYIL